MNIYFNKIKLMKFLDGTIGKLLVSTVKLTKDFSQNIQPSEDMRILIIRPGGIGDAVLLIPTIHSLRRAFPKIKIDILCEKRNSCIFNLLSESERIYLYDKGIDLFKCIKNKYDIVIDTEQWHRLSAVITSLFRAKIKIGYDTNERRKAFNYKISYSHDDYEVYSFFRLIEPLLNVKPIFSENEPFLNFKSQINNFPGLGDSMISIFPGSSIIERKWGGQNYGALAQTLINRGFKIAILGSGNDKNDARVILECAKDAVDFTGKTTLMETAIIVKESKLLITADSGLMHIAYAIGTPTVSLFGAGIEKKWAPRGKNNRVLNKHLPCSPCTKFGYTPRCKIGVKCLASISVEEVITTAELLLS